jgi:DNA-binding HxlR family transcriptional regulator
VACTLDLLGDKWTLLIVRDLFAGRQLFAEFARSPERIASNILADRLQRLQRAGLIAARDNQARQGSHSYHLTERGQSLWPLLVALRDWGLAQLPGTAAKLAVPAPTSSKPTPPTRA